MQWCAPAIYVKLRDGVYIFDLVEEGCNGAETCIIENEKTKRACGSDSLAAQREWVSTPSAPLRATSGGTILRQFFDRRRKGKECRMTKIKPTSESVANGRRSFIRKTVRPCLQWLPPRQRAFRTCGYSGCGIEGPDRPAVHRVGNLEDADRVRRLHQAYESRLDRGHVRGCCRDVRRRRRGGVQQRLFHGKEGIAACTATTSHPASPERKSSRRRDSSPIPAQKPDIVDVAEDRKTATGQFPYSFQVGTPMTGILPWWTWRACRARES